ncbi:MAG: GMC oxidoreductase, partial [Pseudomonadota bacterium]|nr:GMC oxidoreductase [Pseudomonadota bacterium]
RILIAEGRATGVRFTQGNVNWTAEAAAEVILAGGAINSPQLLQLSGIGPGALLAEHGIGVERELPAVGQNLQDHYMAGLRYRLKPGVPSVNSQSHGWRLGREVLRYLIFRRGLLALSAAHVGIFCKSKPELDAPDLQFHVLPASVDIDRLAREQRLELERKPGLSIVPNQMRPDSRGSVRIASPDATVYPTIRANYLAEPRDQQVIVDALKLTRRLSEQSALSALIEAPLEPHLATADDNELLAHARLTGTTAYHQVGTCRMGQDDDSVVDPRLRVHGVAGLRVVDASIMPRLISTNTNAAAIMIGEKASDMILADAL